MKTISSRQLRFILILSVISLKLLLLPSLLYQDCKTSAWIAVFVFFILETFFLFTFLIIATKHPEMTFYNMLTKMFGVVIAKFFLVLYLVYFLFKAYLTFQGNFIFLAENLYDSYEWYIFAIPVMFVAGYIVFAGIQSLARMFEIFLPVVLGAAIVAVFFSLFDVDFTNVLPFFEDGVVNGILPVYRYGLWFGDSMIFLVFMGNIKYEKQEKTKIILSIISVFCFVAFFIMSYICMFGNNSINHKNAISDIVQILPTNSDIGGFGWVLILVWDMALFLYFCLLIFSCKTIFSETFFKKWPIIPIIILLGAVLAISIAVGFDMQKMVDFVRGVCVYPVLVLQYVLPLFFLIFTFRLRRKKE